MKLPHILVLITGVLFLFSCEEEKNKTTANKTVQEIKEPFPPMRMVESKVLQLVLDSANVTGAILLFDPVENAYCSNDFEYAKMSSLPASTFKIPNSIIALETAVVEDDSTLFAWDGEKRSLKVWEQDLIFREAFHVSCVPCYQEIAQKIGSKRMQEHLTKFEYGNMQVDSTNLATFWLEGDSKINQFEQITFLEKFYNSKLSIAERTEKIMKKMMVVHENEDHKISGKTGWSIREGNNKGWFVGYLETKEQAYFFATRVEPKEGLDMKQFPETRKKVTYQALQQLGFIK